MADGSIGESAHAFRRNVPPLTHCAARLTSEGGFDIVAASVVSSDFTSAASAVNFSVATSTESPADVASLQTTVASVAVDVDFAAGNLFYNKTCFLTYHIINSNSETGKNVYNKWKLIF